MPTGGGIINGASPLRAEAARGACEQSLAAAYFPTIWTAVSSAMESLTTEFGMGSGVPSPPWPPRKSL